MPRDTAARPGKRLPELFLNLSKSRRLLFLSIGLTLAFVCGLVVVRSANLSNPAILPGDLASAPAPGNQFNARVARGGNNFLAVWTDNRTYLNGRPTGIGAPTTGTGLGTLDDIYAARLDAGGNVIDTIPIIVSEAQYNQEGARVGWNGQNWLVAWQTQAATNPSNIEIRAVRVSPDGTVLDAVPLVIRSTQSSNSVSPSTVISDGTNWIVMWEGFPTGSVNRSVFVSRVSPSGVVLDPEGKEAYQHTSQYLDGPDLAFGGNGFLLTFVDIGAGPNFSNLLVGVRLNPNLDQSGAPFNITQTGYQVGSAKSKVAFNGQHYMAIWENGFPQSTGNKLLGSRLNTDGQLIDQTPIQFVANMNSYAPQLDLCGDSSMWFASFERSNGTIGEHVRVARVTADGVALDPDGISVSPGSRAALTNSVNGGAEVVFHNPAFDPSYTTSHVNGASVANAGTVGTVTPISLGVPRQTRPRIAQGSNGFMTVFKSDIAGDTRILAQRLDANANPIDAEPILVASGSATNNNPSVAFNGTVYMVVWETGVAGGGWQTLGRRVTPEGIVLDVAPITIMTGQQPDVGALGDTFLVANILPSGEKRYVQSIRVSGAGVVQGTPTRLDFSFNFVPRVAAFGTRWLVVWEHHANHDDSPGVIYGAFVEPDGITLGAFLVGNASGSDSSPHLAIAGTTALVVWSDGNINGRRINADGTFPDPPSGYVLVNAPNLQALPSVAWDGAQYVLNWVDQRNESYPAQARGDIYGARVSVTNITLEEFPVAASQLPEDTPFVAAANGLSIFADAKFYDTAPYKSHRITLQTAHFAPPDVGTIPAAPTNLVATEPNGNPYTNALAWTDNSNNELGFKIEYKIGATGAWSQVAIVGANVTTYSTSVNPNGADYIYRVRAYGLAGDSTYSNEATPPNAPPAVSITSPADGATYRAPTFLVVNATASDSNGTIAQVEFFNGSASWGKVTSSPFTVSRFNVPAGTYSLRAVATDNRGAMTTSAPVNVTVSPQNNSLIWGQSGDNQSIVGPSVKRQTGTPVDKEVADDFDITGTVERVLMNGYRDFTAPRNPVVHGIYVRFYEWLGGVPGALQSEQFIAAGSPNLLYDARDATFFDIQLPTPFAATGKHFMSVQLAIDDTSWHWVTASTNAPRYSALYLRDNLGGATWTHPANADGVFSLYGTLTGRPRLDGLSPTSVSRGDNLIITGANFGGTQGASRVLIDNIPAVVFSWGDSQIKAYVPDAANFGTVQVQVETANGLSNALSLTIAPRQQNGRIKWRFTVDGGYVWTSAAVGPDGSIYFIDDEGRLYAVSADGVLKWIKGAGQYGTDNHVVVGDDGTIYTATVAQPGGIGTSLVGAVLALNPNGTQKWKFVAPDSDSVTFGPEVGPDGKIYVIFYPTTNTPTTLNLVALAPEDGHVVWNYFDRYGVFSNGGRRLAFDAQLGRIYFQSTALSVSNTGLFAHRLDNGQRVNFVSSGISDVIVAPDQTIHTINQSYSPALTLNWTFPAFGQGPTNVQDVGTDSVHYLVQNYYRLFAVNPNGTEKWHFDDCVQGGDCHILDDPVASPTNQVIFVPGLLAYGQPGFFLGVNPANGTELWRVPLPVEPGFGEYGQVRANNRAIFSRDGQTAYISADIAGNYEYALFYAVDVSTTLPCSVSISPQTATAPANGGNGSLSVTSTSSSCNWTTTSSVNWITITSGATGTGNSTVAYNVAANTSTAPRTGTLSINGQTFTVTQAGAVPDSPTVQITYPANNASFTQPTNVFVAAAAAAAPGRVLARVEFYADTQLIGTDTSAPYQIAWNNPATASYALTARAIDNLGVLTNSAPVYITLLPPSGGPFPLPVPPPLVTSPAAEATFTAPATIDITATRQPSNYPTIRMEFYQGTTLLGTDTTAPYSFTWTNVPPGRYTISVRNVGNTGARATSQPIDITVNGENFNIAGLVLNNEGVPLAGVPVALNGSNFNAGALQSSSNQMLRTLAESGNVTVTTDANGNYSFSNLPQGGTYTVAPTANGVTFTPAQAAFSGLRSDQSATFIAGAGTQPQAPRAQVSDFDGDRRTDLAVWQSSSGIWHIIKTGNGAAQLQQWGQSSLGDLAAPGDYDGDGKTDIAIFRPSDGNWYILQSSTGASTIQNWGQNGDTPVPADYDGDGKCDIAVFRRSEGNWYVKKSGGGSTAQGWGDATDTLVPGDYDGDGKSDIAVFRPSEGNWYIKKSSGGSLQVNWGLGADRAVAGDYDGDGTTDIAVFRPSEGNWYIKKSSGGNLIRNWGDPSDRPVPGDYDGDGKTDIAVWRPSEATWYVIMSNTNTSSVQFLGLGGDIPIPGAFIP